MYEEAIKAPKNRFGDQYLAAGYHNQLKIWTQNGQPLLEFATAIK